MKRRHLGASIATTCLVLVGASVGPWQRATAASGQAESSTIANCAKPLFVAGLSNPTSVKGPEQPGSSTAVAVLGSDGSDETLTPVCQWTYTYDPPTGDPTVTFTEYSEAYMAAGTQYVADYNNITGVSCDTTVEALNGFGGGGAQETLTGSYCNTDGYAYGEGSVKGYLTNGTSGSTDTVASFNSTVTSFASGANISYGFFNACSEDPVGSRTNYACNYFYGGPSL